MRPAQAGEVVEHRFGQVTVAVVLHYADCAMTLGELLSVVTEDHRQVRVLRHLGAERLEDIDLARGVVDVVVAADDVGDLHVPVIDDDAEVVGRCSCARVGFLSRGWRIGSFSRGRRQWRNARFLRRRFFARAFRQIGKPALDHLHP